VGTANYWLVIPMVFCENRNLKVLEEALLAPLGYGQKKAYQEQTLQLIDLYKKGSAVHDFDKCPIICRNRFR
jgi:altronate hydrolase